MYVYIYIYIYIQADKEEDELFFKDRHKNNKSEPIDIFKLEYHDKIYYQRQFLGGKDFNTGYLEGDIEMVADEPPKVVLTAVTEGMVAILSEEKCRLNTLEAFSKEGGRKQSILEYILLIVEDIERRLRESLDGTGDTKSEEEQEEESNKANSNIYDYNDNNHDDNNDDNNNTTN